MHSFFSVVLIFFSGFHISLYPNVVFFKGYLFPYKDNYLWALLPGGHPPPSRCCATNITGSVGKFKKWLLHHGNALAHSSYLLQTFLAKHCIPVLREASFCPDMAPCDVWLFRNWRKQWKGPYLSHECTLCRTGRYHCTPFPTRYSSSASNNVRKV